MTTSATYTNITVTQNDQGSNIYSQVYVNNYSTLSATVTGSNYLKVGSGTSIDTFGMCVFAYVAIGICWKCQKWLKFLKMANNSDYLGSFGKV